jgi:hypothetical protein
MLVLTSYQQLIPQECPFDQYVPQSPSIPCGASPIDLEASNLLATEWCKSGVKCGGSAGKTAGPHLGA